MEITFSGKAVLVTGGSQGIGLAIADAFVSAGATVHISGTRLAPDAYEADLNRFVYHQAQMEKPEDRARLLEEVGPLDVLVNNAGGGLDNEWDQDSFERSISVNLVAVMALSQLAHAGLKDRGGCIVNIGSVASFLSLVYVPGYTAAKSGVLGLTRVLADKWARDGIRVNMLAPGYIHTRGTEQNRRDPNLEKRLLAAIPLKRWGQPDEVANAVLFLASPQASYITGTSLCIDGGLMLR